MTGNSAKIKIELEFDKERGTLAMRQFEDDQNRAMKSGSASVGAMNERLNDTLVLYGKVVAAAASLYVVVRVMDQMLEKARALEETTSKFNVVFEGQAEIAERWAATLQDGYKMSEREARQYLGAIQDLLVPMGMAKDAAGALSFEIVKLSADLGSFNNLPTAQVMENIQSALVGEYEAMRKYGVVLTATTVQQRALEMGLAATKEELTAGHKAQAAYVMMLEDSAAAQGDMARTAESWANQEKELAANTEDIMASLGTLLRLGLDDYLVGVNESLGEINTALREAKDEALWEDYGRQAMLAAQKIDAALQMEPEGKPSWWTRLVDRIRRAREVRDLSSTYGGRVTGIWQREAAKTPGLLDYYGPGPEAETPPLFSQQGTDEVVQNYDQVVKAGEQMAKAEMDELEDVNSAWTRFYYDRYKKTEDFYDRVRKEGVQMAEAEMEELEDINSAWTQFYADRVAAEEEATVKSLAVYDVFLERVQGMTADTFGAIYNGQFERFKDFADHMKQYWFQVAGEMSARDFVGNLFSASGVNSLTGKVFGQPGTANTGLWGLGEVFQSIPMLSTAYSIGNMVGGWIFGNDEPRLKMGFNETASWGGEAGLLGLTGPDDARYYGSTKAKQAARAFVEARESMVGAFEQQQYGVLGMLPGGLKGQYLGALENVVPGLDLSVAFSERLARTDELLQVWVDRWADQLGPVFAERMAVEMGMSTELFEKIAETAQQSAQAVFSGIEEGLAAASAETIEQALERSAYEGILNGVTRGLMESSAVAGALQPLLFAQETALERATAGGGFDLATYQAIVMPAIGEFQASLEMLRPIFEATAAFMGQVGGQLNYSSGGQAAPTVQVSGGGNNYVIVKDSVVTSHDLQLTIADTQEQNRLHKVGVVSDPANVQLAGYNV